MAEPLMQTEEVQMVVDIDLVLKRWAKVFAVENETTLKNVVSFALKQFLDREDGLRPQNEDATTEIDFH